MLDRGVEPNHITFGIFMDACVVNEATERGAEVFEELCTKSTPGNVDLLYNSFIRALCKAKQADKALRTYHEYVHQSKRRGPPQLDTNTLPTLLRALSDAGNVDGAFVILGDMRRYGNEVDESIFNRLLSACFKEGNADMAERIFDSLTRAGVTPGAATFSILIKTYGKCKRLEQAFDAVAKMKSYGVEPSVLIFTCLMQACVRNRQTHRALELFAQLKESSMAPDTVGHQGPYKKLQDVIRRYKLRVDSKTMASLAELTTSASS